MYRNFAAGEPNQLIGQQVQSHADVAALAQVYRDPRFETFRLIFVKGGKVVGETGITSRLPALVTFKSKKRKGQPDSNNVALDAVYQGMVDHNADGYYMLHNHPNGKSTPSTEDKRSTVLMATRAPGFLGHIVIDHNEYSTLDANGEDTLHRAPWLKAVDFKSDPVKDHPILGASILGPSDMARVGRALQDENLAVVVMTGGSLQEVKVITSMPVELLQAKNRLDAASKMAALRRISRAGGAGGRMFVVLPKSAPQDPDLYTTLIDGRADSEAGQSPKTIGGFAADVILPNGILLSSAAYPMNVGQLPPFESFAILTSVEGLRLNVSGVAAGGC